VAWSESRIQQAAISPAARRLRTRELSPQVPSGSWNAAVANAKAMPRALARIGDLLALHCAADARKTCVCCKEQINLLVNIQEKAGTERCTLCCGASDHCGVLCKELC
jgi:hypothetical protein